MSAVATKGERKDQKLSCYTIAGETHIAKQLHIQYSTHAMSEQTLIAQWCKQGQHINKRSQMQEQNSINSARVHHFFKLSA